jgi:hypothetical protein
MKSFLQNGVNQAFLVFCMGSLLNKAAERTGFLTDSGLCFLNKDLLVRGDYEMGACLEKMPRAPNHNIGNVA